MSHCPHCWVGQCQRHRLQDHGKREKALKAKMGDPKETLKRMYDSMVTKQLDKFEAAARGTSSQEQDNYKASVTKERDRAERRGNKLSKDKQAQAAKSRLGGHLVQAMLTTSDEEDEGYRGGGGNRKRKRKEKRKRKTGSSDSSDSSGVEESEGEDGGGRGRGGSRKHRKKDKKRRREKEKDKEKDREDKEREREKKRERKRRRESKRAREDVNDCGKGNREDVEGGGDGRGGMKRRKHDQEGEESGSEDSGSENGKHVLGVRGDMEMDERNSKSSRKEKKRRKDKKEAKKHKRDQGRAFRGDSDHGSSSEDGSGGDDSGGGRSSDGGEVEDIRTEEGGRIDLERENICRGRGEEGKGDPERTRAGGDTGNTDESGSYADFRRADGT